MSKLINKISGIILVVYGIIIISLLVGSMFESLIAGLITGILLTILSIFLEIQENKNGSSNDMR